MFFFIVNQNSDLAKENANFQFSNLLEQLDIQVRIIRVRFVNACINTTRARKGLAKNTWGTLEQKVQQSYSTNRSVFERHLLFA